MPATAPTDDGQQLRRAAGDRWRRQCDHPVGDVDWQGLGGGAPPAADGPVLVVAAQPGDESLSCKVWRADQPEPAGWTLQADIADWPGIPGQRPGSAVLLAHEVDATFGDTTVTPLP